MVKIKGLFKYFSRCLLGLALFLGGSIFVGCRENDNTAEDISKISIDFEVLRFDCEFAKATPSELPRLKLEYPYLFPEQYPDSIWIAKLTDTLQRELSAEVHKTFGTFEKESQALKSLFQHIVYYFPAFKAPKVVTLTSDLRYNDRIIFTDTLLLLGLDNYLGKDHYFYQRIPRYIATGLAKQYLLPDVAGAFAQKVIPYPKNRSFLSRMVYHGKILYLKDKLLPSFSDAQKIGYSQEALEWAQANEAQIWRYFVEREMLYSTDIKLDRQFLEPAPFSKFGLELDNTSPGRLGQYIGWQIVRAFMEKNEKSLQALLTLPADDIFKRSNYKPKK